MLSIFKRFRKNRAVESEGTEAPVSTFSPVVQSTEGLDILANIQADMIVMQKKLDDNIKTISSYKENALNKASSYVVRNGEKIFWCDMCSAHTRRTETATHCSKHGYGLKVKQFGKIKPRI